MLLFFRNALDILKLFGPFYHQLSNISYNTFLCLEIKRLFLSAFQVLKTVADLLNPDQVQGIIDKVLEKFGTVDILVKYIHVL